MTADEFLNAFAAELGMPVPSSQDVESLLELAAIAAHASERTAAPIACWIAGAAGGDMSELLAAARRVAPGVQ